MAPVTLILMAIALLRLTVYDFQSSLNSSNPRCDCWPSASLFNHTAPCLTSRLGCPRRRFSIFALLLMGGIESNPGPLALRYGLLNVRSAVNKASSIHDLIQSTNVDFMFITETWFQRSDPPSVVEDVAPPSFAGLHSFRDGRKKGRGGGVSVVYRKSLNFQRFTLTFKPSTFECLPVFITKGNVRTNFVLIYRPPPAPSAIFFDELSTLADALDHCPGLSYLLGDFNCPGQSPGDLDTRLVTFIDDRNASQVVQAPTRLDNLLDLIIALNPDPQSPLVTPSSPPQVMDVLFSDHRMVVHDLMVHSLPAAVITITCRNLKKVDPAKLEKIIRSSPCFTQPSVDPDSFATQIDSDVINALDILAPLRTITKRVSGRPVVNWHTPQTRASKRDCRRLERRFRRTGLQEDYREWRKAGRMCVKSLARARKDFISHEICDPSPKSRWINIRNILHTSHNSVQTNTLTALMFSKHFVDKLRLIALNIASRLNNITCPLVPPPPLALPFHTFSPVSLSQADALLLSLSKSSPIDIIPVSLLKSCHHTFAVLLARLADISFSSGKFPDLYKVARITPLPKKPSLDPSDLSSYRPIANLRTMGKLLERLAQAQLRPHILSSAAFSPYQSAYRPLYSTETAAVFLSNCLLSPSSSSPSLLVSLDLSSAFDCVSHSILLNRLHDDFGLTGLPLTWLHSYLSGRSQSVMWNGVVSPSTTMFLGVPQGSVLGPLLFSAYVSPISRLFHSFGVIYHAYADDTSFIISVDPLNPPVTLLNTVSTAVSNWFLFNDLQLNPTKSEILLVGTQDRRRRVTPLLASGLSVAGSPLSLSSSSKLLGVTFDSALNFDSHVSEICRTANFHLRALAHIRHYLNVPLANLIASSIVASRLDYCNSILTGISSHNLNRLQCIQNRAARIVLGVGHKAASEPLLRKLHWLPITKRIQFKIALLTFKTLVSQQPSYLSSLLLPYNPSRTLRSSSGHFLSVPRVSTAFQSRSFSVTAPRLWNSLPEPLRELAFHIPPPYVPQISNQPSALLNSTTSPGLGSPHHPNLQTFKGLLKTHLFALPPFLVT